MKILFAANLIFAYVIAFSPQAVAQALEPSYLTALQEASCKVAKAYYENDSVEIDKLIKKYGDPSFFDEERLTLIHAEMRRRNMARPLIIDFHCEAEVLGNGIIIVRGALNQVWAQGKNLIALNWDFYPNSEGRFDRIVIDETAFIYAQPDGIDI